MFNRPSIFVVLGAIFVLSGCMANQNQVDPEDVTEDGSVASIAEPTG